MGELVVRPVTEADRARVVRLLRASWGGTTVVAHGRAYDAAGLPALLAERDGEPAGLLTYELTGTGLEIVTLDALRFYQRRGLRIVAVTPGGVDAARALKPSIPAVGEYGIALHDELTLELRLQ